MPDPPSIPHKYTSDPTWVFMITFIGSPLSFILDDLFLFAVSMLDVFFRLTLKKCSHRGDLKTVEQPNMDPLRKPGPLTGGVIVPCDGCPVLSVVLLWPRTYGLHLV